MSLNNSVCEKITFLFTKIPLSLLAVHPMKIGGGGVKLFNFDVTFYKAAVALNIIFLFNGRLTSVNQENYIIPGFWCKNSVKEVIHFDGQNTNVGYSHSEEGGGRIELLRERGDWLCHF